MTLGETAKLCVLIRETTFAWKNESEEGFDEVIRNWHDCLEDVPYDMARKSAIEYIQHNQFAPKIADIYLPYQESIDNKKEKNKQLRKLYYDTISEYPCYKDTPEMQNEWMRICQNDIGKAEQFKQMLVDYVKDHDRKKIDPIPFEEYMKGVKQIE